MGYVSIVAIGTLVFGVMLSARYLVVSPRVSYLAVVFVTWGIWLASLETCLVNRLAVTMLVSLIICLVRPEFVLSFYLAGIGVSIVLIIRMAPEVFKVVKGVSRLGLGGLYRLAAYMSITGLLCVVWSFPMLEGGGRAMVAFGQHYALRWVSYHNSHLDPWVNWKSIVEMMFPGATTPMQALFVNPTEWIRFTIRNILGIISTIEHLFLRVIVFGLAAAFLGLLCLAAKSMYYRVRSIGFVSVLNRLPLVECGLFAISPLMAIILVYPDERYVVILLAALLPFCVAVGRWGSWTKPLDLVIALVAAVAIAAAARPLPIINQPTLKTIIALRKLDLPPHRMLEIDGGWCIYLNPPCIPIFPFEDMPVSEIILDKKVDTIMVSGALKDLLGTRRDRTLDELSGGSRVWQRYDIGDRLYLLHR